MSWIFDKVYRSLGTELTVPGLSTALSTPNQVLYDGRYMWVSNGTNGLYVYELWGATTNHEPAWDQLDLLTYPRYDSGINRKPRLVTVIKLTATAIQRVTCEPSLKEEGSTEHTLASGEKAWYKSTARTGSALNAYWLAQLGERLYVTNGSSFSEIYEFNVQTQNFTGTPVANVAETFDGSPRAMRSNLCASGARLWFVGGYTDTTDKQDPIRQRFYAYDPVASIKTIYDMTQRPTVDAITQIADGKNGSVYLTLYNDVGVLKVNNLTGAQTYVRFNAAPTAICSDESRRIWVNSFAGMQTLIDWDDSQVHNDWGTELTARWFQVQPDNGNLLWFIRNDNMFVRYDLNTKQQYELGTTEDWHFNDALLAGLKTGTLTYEQHYQKEDGTDVTVKPYFWGINANALVGFRLDRYLRRPAYMKLTGNAAVSSGPEFYFGD